MMRTRKPRRLNRIRTHSNTSPIFEALEPRTLMAVFTVNTLGDVIANDGMTTLREAITQANNTPGADEVRFALGGTFVVDSQLEITDDLTITGKNPKKTKISAGVASRVFFIYNGTNNTQIDVNLQNLTIQNGNNGGQGGGIYSQENLTLDSCRVVNNHSDSDGGGIFQSLVGALTLTNTTVLGNSAGNEGGGVHFNSVDGLNIVNSTFSGNAAISDGGGLFSRGGSTLTNTRFVGNTADNDGGGVNFSSGNHTIDGGTFRDNFVTGSGDVGGGVFISNSSNITIGGASFRDNVSGSGGGIYNGGNLTLEESTLRGNRAFDIGGGLWNNGSAMLNNVTFRMNTTTEGDGGGICNEGTLDVQGSTITRNTAGDDGGGLFNSSTGSLNLEIVLVTRNNSMEGGGIYSDGGEVNILGSTLSRNTAGSGGGIENDSGSTANISNSTISKNKVTGEGGGIENDGTVNLIHSTLHKNSAEMNGGGIDNFNGDVNLSNSTLSKNSTKLDGGGVFNGLNGSVEIDQSTFSGNRAVLFGGNIVNLNTAFLDVRNSTITGGRGGQGGDGVINFGDFFLQSTIVAGNSGVDIDGTVQGTAPVNSNSSFNLIGSTAFSGGLTNTNNNIVGGNAMLGPLRNNGGPTFTHAPKPGSPVLDMGSIAALVNHNNDIEVINFDQRGQGFFRFFGDAPDIGAFESQGTIPASLFFVGADKDESQNPVGPVVRAFTFQGDPLFSFFAFDPSFTGGVRVATGDVNGDGDTDIIAAMGPGGTGSELGVFTRRGERFINSLVLGGFTGGYHVASGDLNGDGFDDVLLGQDEGTTDGKVRIVSMGTDNNSGGFTAFPGFAGGVRVASADVNGDGVDDMIAAAGVNGTQVRVYNGDDSGAILFQFDAFAQAFTGGVYVAAGDVNGDGKADIITSGGDGHADGPVRVFNGASTGPTPTELHSFNAYTGFNGGVRIASWDLDNNGTFEIFTAPASGLAPTVKIFAPAIQATPLEFFDVFEQSFLGGVFIG